MKKIMNNFIFVFTFVFAMQFVFVGQISAQIQATSSIAVDGLEVVYNNVLEADLDDDGSIDRLSYYLEDLLVLTTYDTTEDGIADLWLVYDKNLNIIMEVADTDGDEQFDLIVDIGENEQVLSIEDLQEELEEVLNSESDQNFDTNGTLVDDTVIDVGIINNLFSKGRVGIIIGLIVVFGLVFIIKRRR